jgi:hypothetical protein
MFFHRLLPYGISLVQSQLEHIFEVPLKIGCCQVLYHYEKSLNYGAISMTIEDSTSVTLN